MTQSELIQEVVERLDNVPRATVEEVVKATFDAMFGALADHDEVSIAHFGKFEVREQAARVGRNPQTGETLTIPARNVPKFKSSSTLKEAVNG